MTDTGGCRYHFPTVTAQSLDPDPVLAEIREREGIARVQLPFGAPCWMLTRYEDVRSMLGDHRFSRAATIDVDVARTQAVLPIADSLLGMDPPDHTRIRRLVSLTFTARRMEALRSRAQEVVDDLLDAMASAPQPVDIVEGLALPLPITMICELLGVPFEDRHRFKGWADCFMTSSGFSLDEVLAAHEALSTYLEGLIAGRRRAPTDDLLGALVALRDDEERMTEPELVSLARAILIAGYETTTSQIGKFVLCLLERPDQLARLRADPALVPNAVEELMRYVPLAGGASIAYLATEDVEISGVVIERGDAVIASGAAANRDESAFGRADEVDVGRADIFQLGFGHGAHFCLGAHLARVELQVALGSLLARFPDLRLGVPADQVAWKQGSSVWGLESLPVYCRT